MQTKDVSSSLEVGIGARVRPKSTAGIRVCSWNVAEIDPEQVSQEEYLNWLGVGTRHERAAHPDIVAIGLQEVDMSLKALVKHKKSTEKSRNWTNFIDKSLADEGYKQLCVQQLMGLLLVVMGKDHISPTDVEIATSATGWFGICGNKGAICSRVRLCEHWYCFVNSHLAPHQGAVETRNKHYRKINDKTIFLSEPRSIQQHDFVFWFGDLNYRLDLAKDEAQRLRNSEDCYSRLLPSDQLNKERNAGRAFRSFSESNIEWRPTYKFNRSTDEYSAKRSPAYCDRVLWYEKRMEGTHLTGSDAQVQCQSYTSHHDVFRSDHKPVAADFWVTDVLTL